MYFPAAAGPSSSSSTPRPSPSSPAVCRTLPRPPAPVPSCVAPQPHPQPPWAREPDAAEEGSRAAGCVCVGGGCWLRLCVWLHGARVLARGCVRVCASTRVRLRACVRDRVRAFVGDGTSVPAALLGAVSGWRMMGGRGWRVGEGGGAGSGPPASRAAADAHARVRVQRTSRTTCRRGCTASTGARRRRPDQGPAPAPDGPRIVPGPAGAVATSSGPDPVSAA